MYPARVLSSFPIAVGTYVTLSLGNGQQVRARALTAITHSKCMAVKDQNGNWLAVDSVSQPKSQQTRLNRNRETSHPTTEGWSILYAKKFEDEFVNCVCPTVKYTGSGFGGACVVVCDGTGEYDSMQACIADNTKLPPPPELHTNFCYVAYISNTLTPTTYGGLPYYWEPPLNESAVQGYLGLGFYESINPSHRTGTEDLTLDGTPPYGMFEPSIGWGFDNARSYVIPGLSNEEVAQKYLTDGHLWFSPDYQINNEFPPIFGLMAEELNAGGWWDALFASYSYSWLVPGGGIKYSGVMVPNWYWRCRSFHRAYDFNTQTWYNQYAQFPGGDTGGRLRVAARLYPAGDPTPPPPPDIESPDEPGGGWSLLYDTKDIWTQTFLGSKPVPVNLPERGFELFLKTHKTKEVDLPLFKINEQELMSVYLTQIGDESEILFKLGHEQWQTVFEESSQMSCRIRKITCKGTNLSVEDYSYPQPYPVNSKNWQKPIISSYKISFEKEGTNYSFVGDNIYTEIIPIKFWKGDLIYGARYANFLAGEEKNYIYLESTQVVGQEYVEETGNNVDIQWHEQILNKDTLTEIEFNRVGLSSDGTYWNEVKGKTKKILIPKINPGGIWDVDDIFLLRASFYIK